ncbi:insulinase family protein [Marinospirillum perlucidum]|uniref:insulinase family protein n=1 Tax=Marinospirillum perlucidum TaxID=1982602 RepID=UPI000DF1D527|nr:insulinase family protein [Marinospirillum perlucidum]
MTRIRHLFPKVLLLALVTASLTACSQFGIQSFMDRLPTPHNSPEDQRSYRSLGLDNGLTLLLISDPQAEKAAASMNIAAGSYHEPEAWPGLAHYLEHMLFLGTEEFPEADGYQKFIRQQGGSYNAFTAPRATNYFFDIRPQHLDRALHRFSRFFVDPLLTPEYLEREVQAVDSEWSGTLQDDGRRRLDALRQALNPEHPASRFTAGNRQSLDVTDPQLRPALVRFYERHYQPQKMSLVILGPQNLDQLEKLAREYFSDLDGNTQTSSADWPSLLPIESLPARLDIKPLRQHRELQLLFPIPDPTEQYASKPASYLGHLIGHEGEGSLLEQLKQRGWVTALSAGSQNHLGQEALFSITLQLTEEGDRHLEEIQAAVFAWIDLVRQQGIEAWRFEENALMARLNFRYSERPEPSQLVTHLAVQMKDYPLEDLLRAPYAWDHFNPELIRQYLNQLTPQNRLIVHTSPEVETDQTTTWVPTEYRLQQPLSQEEASLPEAPADLQLQLPEPNPYLPRNLELLEGENQTRPQRLDTSAGIQVWHGLDTSFGLPKARIHISLQNPQVPGDLNQQLLSQLAARWLEDELNTKGYPARLAGLNYQVYGHSKGITLVLGGYSSEQQRLAQELVTSLLTGQVTDDQYQRLSQSLEQQLHNLSRQRLSQQLVRQLFRNTTSPSWTPEEQLNNLQQLNSQDLKHFLEDFTQQLHLQVLAWGNISREQTGTLMQMLDQQLEPRIAEEQLEDRQVRQVPAGYWSQELHLVHNDRGLLFYIQGRNASLEEEARLRLINQLQAAAFFHELRTQQQLGYAVYSHFLPLQTLPGLFYYIQSPATAASDLASAIEAFLRSDLRRLEDLSEQDFSQHQQSLVSRLTEKDKRLAQRVEGFWREIGLKRLEFDRQQALAEVVQQLSQEEIIDYYIQMMNVEMGFYLLGSSPDRHEGLLPGRDAKPDSWPLQ